MSLDDEILTREDVARIARLESDVRHTAQEAAMEVRNKMHRGDITPREARKMLRDQRYGVGSGYVIQRDELYGPSQSMTTSGPNHTKGNYQEPGSHAVETRF